MNEVELPPEFRIYEWGELQERTFAYLVGVMETRPTFYGEKIMVVLFDDRAKAEEFSYGMSLLGFKAEVVEDGWRVDEAEKPIYGVAVTDILRVKMLDELWVRVMGFVVTHALDHIRGIVTTTGRITPAEELEIYVLTDASRLALSRKLDAMKVEHRVEEGTVETPTEIFYPDLEAKGVTETKAFYFILDSVNMRKLLFILGLREEILARGE